MAIKSHYGFTKVGIPNKHIEVEPATHQNFMLIAVSHFSYGSGVPFKGLNWSDGQITENFIAHWMIFKELLDLLSHLLLSSPFFGVDIIEHLISRIFCRYALNLFLA